VVTENGGVSDSGDASAIREVRLRRAPRLPIFLVLGALLGAIVTLIVTASQPADPKIGFAATYGYFCVFGVPAGIVFGALVGLVLDRVSVRRSRVVNAELEQVEAPAAPAEE
jgi:hypothetical protein